MFTHEVGYMFKRNDTLVAFCYSLFIEDALLAGTVNSWPL